MKFRRRAGEVMDNIANPIVVKELRQAVQGKFVIVVLMLFLLVSVSAMWIYLFTQTGDTVNLDAGREAFAVFGVVLLGTCLLCVPAYAGIRLTTERADVNSDLMFVTTLKPRSIIFGKVVSAMMISVLITCACLPFITLTYLLRGVDLPTIFVLMFLGMVAVLVGVQLAVLLGSLPLSKGFRGLLGLVGLGGLSFIMSGMCLWAAELLDSGVGSMIGTWQFWGSMLSVLLLVFMGLGLMFVLSTAMISPASANRALPIRTYITAMWLVGGACAVAWSVSTRRLEPVCIWEMVFGGLLCLVFLASVSERETLGPRVAKQIPQRVTVRLGLFFFYSGGAGGVLWATVLFLLTLGVAEAWRVMNPAFRVTGDLSDISARMTNLGMYFLGYAMMGLFIRRVLLGRFVKPVLTWMVVVGLMVACTMIPLLAAFFAQIEIERHQNYVWSIANPFSMFVYTRHVPEFTAFAVGWAVLGVFLNLRWFYRQIRSFRPLHQDEPAVEPQAA